jgi:hypothetical protein
LLVNNERQEGNQALSFSLKGGFFFTEQLLETAVVSVRSSATTRVPTGGFLSPPTLACFRAGRALREDPGGGNVGSGFLMILAYSGTSTILLVMIKKSSPGLG